MKQAKVLSDVELKRVLAVCAQQCPAGRNRLLILLSYYAGLRVSKIASLKWSDVLTPNGEYRTLFHLQAVNTKANEARAVHMNVILLKELKQYCLVIGEPRSLDQPLIASQVSRMDFPPIVWVKLLAVFMRVQELLVLHLIVVEVGLLPNWPMQEYPRKLSWNWLDISS